MLLIQGTTGTNVKYLQYGLKIKCFNPKRTDGVFDANTTSALKRYQTFKRLTADGKADELTWATLKEDIKLIQASLQAKGYYTGNIDGIAGNKTYNSLIHFQLDNGLASDGMAGNATLGKLYDMSGTKIIPNFSSDGVLKEMVENMVCVALAEEFADRFEGLSETDRGKENYNKYLKWYPYQQGSPWCACFVSWCAYKAGILDIEGQARVVPRSVSVAAYCDYYIKNSRIGYPGKYIPKRGDVFILKKSGASHVGIVTGYDISVQKYSTIEGNTERDTVAQKLRSINTSTLYGFGINTDGGDI